MVLRPKMEPALEAIFEMTGLPIAPASDVPSLQDLTSG